MKSKYQGQGASELKQNYAMVCASTQIYEYAFKIVQKSAKVCKSFLKHENYIKTRPS